jgi:hypothetical protein
VGVVDTPGLAWDVSVAKGIACVADHDFGLQVINVHDPEAPEIIDNVPTPQRSQPEP